MSFLNFVNCKNNLQIVTIILIIINFLPEINSLPPLSLASSSATDTCECHHRNFDLCSSHLVLLSQPVPMMPPGDVFDRMCSFLNESYQCRQEYLTRCSTPSALVMLKLMTQKNDAAFHSVCAQPESAYWKSLYTASYYCLQSTKMLCRPCVLDYQSGLETAMVNETTQISGGCCAFNRLVTCTSDIILNTCGPDALSVSKKIASIFASSVANNLCRNYPEESPFCLNLLPPVGTLPKGDSFAQYTQIFGSNPSGSWPSMGSTTSMGSNIHNKGANIHSMGANKWPDVSTWSKSMKHFRGGD